MKISVRQDLVQKWNKENKEWNNLNISKSEGKEEEKCLNSHKINPFEKQQSAQTPLRSNEIIEHIHTINREKRVCKPKFGKVKSFKELNLNFKEVNIGSNEIKNRINYDFDKDSHFFTNPIEILRQERLKREKIRKIKIQKEREKLNILEALDIR